MHAMGNGEDRVAEGIARWAATRPDLDTSGTEVVGRVLRLGAVFQEAVARQLSPHGLAPGEYSVLAILRSQGGPEAELTPTALSRATYLSTGGMANLLKGLEADGLVVRRPDPSDRRGVLVRLTAAGRERVDRAVSDVAEAERRLVEGLSTRERRALARTLSRLLVSVDPRSVPAAPAPGRRRRLRDAR
jgi:DNA-binding MarR family transcriptional regulator